MQQPYRQMVLASGAPMTCLDPPRNPPCADARPARRRLASLGGAALFLVCVSSPLLVVLLEAPLASAGRIEIGSRGLARLRARQAPTSHAHVVVSRMAPPKAPPPRAVVSWFDSSEHDPSKIVTDAHKLQTMGVDVTVVDVELARSTVDCFDTFGYWPAVALPTGTHTTALDLGDLPSDSPAIAAGLQKHDLLLSIDGYRIDGWRQLDVERIRSRGSVALEVERNGRRILLTIRWRTRGMR
jgi:membrane-associated protease RseP (regulator of RpoE activity)